MNKTWTLRNCNRGSSLLEILVGVVLLSVMGLAIAKSTIITLQTRDKNLRESTAMLIAIDAVESFSGIDPANLSDSDDATSTVSRNGIDFTQAVDVTVNPDQSVSLAVVVATDRGISALAELEIRLTAWGNA